MRIAYSGKPFKLLGDSYSAATTFMRTVHAHRLALAAALVLCCGLASESNAAGYSDAECRQSAATVTANNAVLIGQSTGPHVLSIINGTSGGGYVKVKTLSGSTVVGFYIQAGSNASVNLPDGTYGISFATGESFSSLCRKFMDHMQALEFPEADTFQTRKDSQFEYYTELEYTLHSIVGGNVSPDQMNIDEFLRD